MVTVLRNIVVAAALSSAYAFTPPAPAATAANRATTNSFAAAAAPPRAYPVEMGRGDKRTAKGKRKSKSFGNSRPRKLKPASE